jgi:tetratricopeptide (TPR) repeat protein
MSINFKAFLIAILFLFNGNLFANNYDPIWKLLLNNKREDALKQLTKIKNYDHSTEGLLLEHLIKSQLGQFEFDHSFIQKGMKNGLEFEYVMNAFQNDAFLFGKYNSDGFYAHNVEKLKMLEKYNFKSNTVRDSYKYVLSHMYQLHKEFVKKQELGTSPEFINQWKIVGSFENLNNSGINEKYEVETNIDKETYDANSNGMLNWYTLDNMSGEPFSSIKAHQQYGDGTTYFKTYLNSSESKEILLHFGTNAAIKVWLNDQEIFLNEFLYYTDLDYYKIKTTLQSGNNLLLVKLGHSSSPYLSCKITNTDGSVASGIDKNVNGTGVPIRNIDLKYETVDNEVLAYFKSIEAKSFFLSKICSISFYSRNGVKDKAREIIQDLELDFPNSSFLNSLLIECLDDDSKDQQQKAIYASMEVNDSTFYLPHLIKVADTDQMFKMSNESFEALVDKLNKMYNIKQMTQLLDLVRFGKKNDMVGMKDAIEGFIADYSSNPKIVFDMATVLGNLGYDTRLEEILKDLNKKYYYYPAHYRLANLYKSQGNSAKSKELLLENEDFFKNDFSFYENIGNYLFNSAEYTESKIYYDKALKIYPNSFTTQEKIGDILIQQKNQSEALTYYNKSLIHNTGNYELRQKIKNIAVKQDIFDKTVQKDQYEFINTKRGKNFGESVSLNFLYDESNIMIYKEGGTRHRNYIAYEIISTPGIDLVKEIDLGLYSNYHIHAMEIIKTNGQRIPADRNGSHGVFNGLEVGDVVYLDYEYNSAGSGRFHKDFQSRFQFGGIYPTTLQKIRLFLPENETISYSVENGNIAPMITNNEGFKIYDWTQKEMTEAPILENYAKNGFDIFPILHISTIDSWNEISKWYSDLVNSQFEDSKIVQNLFTTLFPNGYKTLTEKERAHIIYKYMCQNLTYSFVSFRQSGFVPQKPEKTIRTKLGDCKDFSTLFAILAKKADIEVELVLVLTSDYGMKSIVKPNTDFNHCIVKAKLDNVSYYIELTDKNLPFLAGPRSLIGAAAIEVPIKSVKKETKDLFNIPSTNMLKDYLSLNVDHLVTKSNQNFILQYEIGGADVSYYNAIFKDGKEKYEAEIKDRLGRFNIKEFIIDSIVLTKQNDFDSYVQYKVFLTVKDAFQKVGKTILVPLFLFDKVYTQDLLTDKRHYTLDYKLYEDKVEYLTEYHLKLDKDLVIKEMPDNFNSSYKTNNYSISFTQTDDKNAIIKRKFSTGREDIMPEEFATFKDHVRNVLDTEAAFIGVGTVQN